MTRKEKPLNERVRSLEVASAGNAAGRDAVAVDIAANAAATRC